MTDRTFRVLNVSPIHVGPGESSYIVMYIELTHLKNKPVEAIRLTPGKAIELIEQLALAIRVTTR